MNSSNVKKIMIIMAVGFYVLSGVMLYKGYHKMTKYENPDSAWRESVNAYVGGDAYNYIINSGYATGFFVLSMGFLASGTICMGTGLIVEQIGEAAKKAPSADTPEAIAEQLPEL